MVMGYAKRSFVNMMGYLYLQYGVDHTRIPNVEAIKYASYV